MSSIGSWSSRLSQKKVESQWNENTSKSSSWLIPVVFYTILANIPYWVVEREFGFTPLGWFCIQYATVGLIALISPGVVTAILLFAVIAADLLCGTCVTFNLPIKPCLDNLRAAGSFSVHRCVMTIVSFALLVLVSVAAALLPGRHLPSNQRRRAAALLAGFAILILGADRISIRLESGHGPSAALTMKTSSDGIHRRSIDIPRMCRLPFLRLVRLQSLEAGINEHDRKGPAAAFPAPSATAFALTQSGVPPISNHGGQPNVVLVLVESWGSANNASLRQALVDPYSQPDIASRYQVIQGSVAFHGSTIPGEARELCGSGFGFHLLTASAPDLQTCLPDRFAALGYRTIAVHGLNGRMFNRSKWYQTIGFQQQWFHDQLKQIGLADCAGAFIGTCDADIAAWAGQLLDSRNDKPIFLHWMTLNSHLPVPVPTHLSNGASCDATLSLAPDTPLCSWYQLIANVHRSVAQLASAPMNRPTVFVIVGDHAPPFGDDALRDKFSQADVPYVILVPRPGHPTGRPMLAHNSADSVPHLSTIARP